MARMSIGEFAMASAKLAPCKLPMAFLSPAPCAENRESKECVVIVTLEVFLGLVSVDAAGAAVGRERL